MTRQRALDGVTLELIEPQCLGFAALACQGCGSQHGSNEFVVAPGFENEVRGSALEGFGRERDATVGGQARPCLARPVGANASSETPMPAAVALLAGGGDGLQLFCSHRVLDSNDVIPVHLASSRPIDPNEFTAFMRAFQDMVFSTAIRLTADPAQAEDISQEVFLRAYESFDRLRSSPKVGGWLKTVATNLSLNYITRHRRRRRLFSEVLSEDATEDELESAAAVFDQVLAEIETDERRAWVEQALERLPDHQRLPLVLYHFEDMSYQDIAARLKVSLAKVKTDILRGRVALAGSLAKSGLAAPSAAGVAQP